MRRAADMMAPLLTMGLWGRPSGLRARLLKTWPLGSRPM